MRPTGCLTPRAATASAKSSTSSSRRGPSRASRTRANLRDREPAARRMRRVNQLRSLHYEDGLHNHALVGTPAAVAERLMALKHEIGLSGILAELNCGGLIPHEQVLTAMQLLCEVVKPRFAA